jgi:hypothetical protein
MLQPLIFKRSFLTSFETSFLVARVLSLWSIVQLETVYVGLKVCQGFKLMEPNSIRVYGNFSVLTEYIRRLSQGWFIAAYTE